MADTTPMPPPGAPEPEWDAEAAVNAARQKVQTFLLRETEIGLDQRGRLTVDRGSTRVFVEFVPQPDKKLVYVTLTAPIAFYVPMSPALFEHLARNADKWFFGHLSMNPYAEDSEHAGQTYVYFTDTVIADYADPEELAIRTFAVVNTANSLDEDFVAQFGGTRYQDS